MNEIVKDAFELCDPAFQVKRNDKNKGKSKGKSQGKSKGKSTKTSLADLIQSLPNIEGKALHSS